MSGSTKFVSRLGDEEIQHASLLACPRTLMTALSAAVEFEAAKEASRKQAEIQAVKEEGNEAVVK